MVWFWADGIVICCMVFKKTTILLKMWSGSGKINKATSNYVSKTTSKPSKKKANSSLKWCSILKKSAYYTKGQVWNVFFIISNIWRCYIRLYYHTRAWSSRLIIIEKKIELAKNIVKFFFGHIQKHKKI